MNAPTRLTRESVFAEAAAREARVRIAGKMSHGVPLSVQRPTPVEEHPARQSDPRPQAAGREPCVRCGTRGDLGCRHRAPCELPEKT